MSSHTYLLLSHMRSTCTQLEKELENVEAQKIKIEYDIKKYKLGLIGEAQHKAHKKFRTDLNKRIKDIKRQIELLQ